MPSIFVASYSVKVRERRSKGWSNLRFDKGNKSVREIVSELMTHLKTKAQVDAEAQQLLRVSKLQQDKTDIWGIVEAGDYGYEAQLLDSKTLSTSYNKGVDEAEMVPLYFRFHLPDNGDTGIWIVQRLGNRGAFSAVKNMLNNYWQVTTPDHLLAIARFVPTSVMESLTNGGVKEISVTTHTLPQDLADRFMLGGAKKSVAKVELRVTAKKGSVFTMNAASWLKKLEKEGTKILEVPDETPTIRVKVDYKGRKRMYDLQKMDVVAPYVDISEDVEHTRRGHPRFASINDYCVELRDELLEQVGLEAPQ